MSPSGLLLLALAVAVSAVLLVVLTAVIRHAPRARAAAALARGDFEASVGSAAGSYETAELVPASVAARHLGDLETAVRLSRRAVKGDPDDGEAWLELALAQGYAGDFSAATAALDRARERRADFLEAVTLHRAWLALRSGDPATALHLFAEVEAPLETKLRCDLGSGEPVFADWFFQAGELWRAADDEERSRWALAEARRSAPGSRLFPAEKQHPLL